MTKRLVRMALATVASLAMVPLMAAGAAHAVEGGGDGGAGIMIIGGEPATEQYRFHASLQYRDPGERPSSLRCGAALLTPEWLVTAGHCLTGRDPADFFVRVGSNDYTEGGTVVDPIEFVVHPDFPPPSGSANDIGLIRLAAPVPYQPIRMAEIPDPGTPVRMIGWGRTVDGDPASIPDLVRQQDTRVLPFEACQWGDEWVAQPGDICVDRGDNETAGPCNGDSGSPLLVRARGGWRVAGVDSRAGGESGCLQTDEVYTGLQDFWLWIQIVTGTSDT